MFQIGDKVIIDADTKHPVEGYIVAITIDPITENEVEFEKKNWVIYKVRVYKNFYKYGYTDFYRDVLNVRKVNEDGTAESES